MALAWQQTHDVSKILVQFEDDDEDKAQGAKPHETNEMLANEIKTDHDEKEKLDNQANVSRGLKQRVNGAIADSVGAIYAGGLMTHAGVVILVSATLLTGGAALPAISATYQAYRQNKRQKEKDARARTKAYNEKVELFNAKLKHVKEIEAEIADLQKRLREEEDKVNNKKFAIERHTVNSRIVAAIGPCGFGKSAFCNRMTGNDVDIDDMVGNADFSVAAFGDTKSYTNKIRKVPKNVHLREEGDEKRRQSFRLSVVDTPGAFDSKGQDDQFDSLMVRYFKACGGVNMFCIFYKIGGKIDANYQKVIEHYCNFWNPKASQTFWEHCVVVITHCDLDSPKNRSRVEAALPQVKADIQEWLAKVSKGLCGAIPVFEFGEENFYISTKQLLISLADTEGTFATKYTCKKVEAEIDRLWTKLKEQIDQHCRLSQDLQARKQELEEFDLNG